VEFVLYGLLAVILLVFTLSALAPTRVAYIEEIIVHAPAAQVYDDIRLQARLMRWSSWPKETKSTCALEGADGEVGAKTVFFTKGKRVGHQEVVSLKENAEITFKLIGPGPPHRPQLRLELRPLGERQTHVFAHFANELPRPFNAIWRFAGLSKWTRTMHQKDLAGLKMFSEPPHRDATGQTVGHPPEGPNPFEHKTANI